MALVIVSGASIVWSDFLVDFPVDSAERAIKGILSAPGGHRFRWSIGARLAIAFVSVAALAVAANFLAEHAMSIVHVTRVVHQVETLRASVPSPVAVPTPAPGVAEIPAADPEALIGAIERYENAVRARVMVHSAVTDEQVSAAASALEREATLYLAQSGHTPNGVHLESLRTAMSDYRAHGDALLQIAGQREQIVRDFWDCFDALDARTKAALARSWRIFGRVIARNSLVDFNSSLDAIRREYAIDLAAPGSANPSLDAVSGSAAALAASVQTHEAALAHSLGEPWVAKLRTDLERIGSLQQALQALDGQRSEALADFARESLSVMALAGATKASALARARVAHTVVSSRADAGPLPSGAAANGSALVSPVPAATEADAALNPQLGTRDTPTEDTSVSLGPSEYSASLLWLSAAVLLLLLCVSVLTVASVVGPVRRMRVATRRLAAGELPVKVARGGLPELDDLAVSFNQMAEQLAAAREVAREHQEQLETKVSLRTRELRHLAEHDSLTDLPNRRQLFARLKEALVRAAADGSHVGVFFLDLDNFKNINDSMGHAFGDRVLAAVAARLTDSTRAGGFAARLGGDEFTVIRDGVASEGEVRLAGWDLVRAFQTPLRVDDRELMISVSVGVSLYPQHGDSADALLRAADAALFRAKALGRSQLTEFSSELLVAASTKFSTEQGLRHALERREFELVFQPEVNATSFTTGVVEALLRWRLPDGRRASPAEFLAIAEESGLIMEISDWVLDSAVAAASRWYHGAWPEAKVAINLSSRQLLDSQFVERLLLLLQRYKVPTHCIEIELTENVLQTGIATIDVLQELREHGVSIALDDFGTGFSSFSSVEQLPLTRVKLDQTLIARVHTSVRSAAIARAIVSLCHNIGLEVTAEGIECQEQLLMLSDMAPITLQGYLLARPISAEQVVETLAALPSRLESILLAPPGRPNPHLEASVGDYTVRNLRKL